MDRNIEERTTIFDTFTHTLGQLSEVVTQLTAAENAKADAASAREHRKMDLFLKEEQALLLKMKGLEQQRERRQAELGWKGLSFRQILKKAEGEELAALSPLFLDFERQVKELAEAKESASRIITIRLREFGHILGTGKNGGVPGSDFPPHFHDRYV